MAQITSSDMKVALISGLVSAIAALVLKFWMMRREKAELTQ